MPCDVMARMLRFVQSTSVFSDFQVLGAFIHVFTHLVLNSFVSVDSYVYHYSQDTAI